MGDMPAVVMLVWAGWLAVPLSLSGLAQARAAVAAAYDHDSPLPAPSTDHPSTSGVSAARDAAPRHSTSHVPQTHDGAARHGASHLPHGHDTAAYQARHHTAGAPGIASHAACYGDGSQAAAGLDLSARPACYGDLSDGAASLDGSARPAGRHAWSARGTSGSPAALWQSSLPAPAAPADTRPAASPLSADSARTPASALATGTAGTQAAANALTTQTTDGRAATSALVAEMVARERARIAGEVHDAAGHGFSTIAMQAGLALLVLEENPEQARESLRAIRETSLAALAGLRGALDLIDAREGDDQLTGLVAGVRAAGLPVDLEPAEPDVPSHLRGTVYRVARESLTNVIRHAGPTRALVKAVDDGRGGFVLEVADRGRGASMSSEGRGLTSMRERVLAAGGEFSAGPRDGGGFSVVARFPRGAA
ncbi:sensor histidine kinase [Nonomuraea sp. NPDC003804]|uniref:sensor histidine kinase n=1 Tax=Nonomuraea sp. NPDC003804 TaxID=3154547 RepID=UPI0033A21B30